MAQPRNIGAVQALAFSPKAEIYPERRRACSELCPRGSRSAGEPCVLRSIWNALQPACVFASCTCFRSSSVESSSGYDENRRGGRCDYAGSFGLRRGRCVCKEQFKAERFKAGPFDAWPFGKALGHRNAARGLSVRSVVRKRTIRPIWHPHRANDGGRRVRRAHETDRQRGRSQCPANAWVP